MTDDPRPGVPGVGVLLPTREHALAGDFAAAPLLEFARRAEQLGFDSVWAGDSLTARPRLDPLVLLSAVGAVTSEVTLGTAALTAALRPPLAGANTIAALDQVCDSRLVLGLGAGFPIPESEAEFAAAGVPFEGRAGRLDETAALWRTAWRSTRQGAPTGFEGRRWRIEGLDRLPAPHRPGGPPLWLASSDTPRVLERVARLYDGWLPFLPSAEAYGRARRRIEELAVAAGRPADAVTPALYATLAVDTDRERARRELDHYLRQYYGRTLEQMSPLQAYAWGSAEECVEWLAEYVRAGARHVILRVGSLRSASGLKEIADQVLPMLRDRFDR